MRRSHISKLSFKSFLVGFIVAALIPVGAIFILFFGIDYHTIVHEQVLATGKTIKILSTQLVWGIEHGDRFTERDCFALEYVSSIGNTDEKAVDQETLEAFELIRPISEQWAFSRATVASFPRMERKGKYYLYDFTRLPNGQWDYTREVMKVFIND